MEQILLFLLTGVVSGILAGLLGIGGGLIIVPALNYILTGDPTHTMHVAIGTSLAVVTLTAISSARAHHKKGTLNWDYWRLLSPGLFSGTLAGAFIADMLQGETLRNFFAVFEVLVALQLLLDLNAKPSNKTPGFFALFLVTLPIGMVSAFAGIGGGSMVVPLLMWLRLPIKQAISTSAACGLPIAIAGTSGFMLTGLDVTSELSTMSTGFIYWPAFLFISIPAVLLAPVGAKIAHALPSQLLRIGFALFLILLAIFMFVK
ncbi:MAG: sulfite exporter TauE/SafE family protein [Gammaproteobacteria bacterium]|nr:sulfite exporter TauE/SafE family protein [Gammaproteobacteria bacterium]MDH5802352.1 sulfite exporter TauE/SafE family protein [Gammaproteobacteria bacterium]